MNPVGRPEKVSVEVAKRIANLLLQGITEAAAAEACGIDRASFFNYMNRATAGEPEYQEFGRIIREAKDQRKTWKKAPRNPGT